MPQLQNSLVLPPHGSKWAVKESNRWRSSMEASAWLWTRFIPNRRSGEGQAAGQQRRRSETSWTRWSYRWSQGWRTAAGSFQHPQQTHTLTQKMSDWLTDTFGRRHRGVCLCVCVHVSVFSSLSLSATAPFLSLHSAANPCLPPPSASPSSLSHGS